MTRCATLVLALAVVTVILTPSNSWRRRRRRQFICKRTDCKLSQWSAWAACSRTCKGGTTTRIRQIAYHESCGGSCPSHPLNETRSCNIQQCCPVDCAYSWSAWSACTGCGISTKFRTPIIKVLNWCNGKVCPGKEIRSCKTGKWVLTDAYLRFWLQFSLNLRNNLIISLGKSSIWLKMIENFRTVTIGGYVFVNKFPLSRLTRTRKNCDKKQFGMSCCEF